jgi:hypothetical protein
MTLMSRISRICAWILLVSVVIFFISGFDIQGRFLSPQLSSLVHLKYLLLPVELAFTFHASFAMNQAFRRWKLAKALRIGIISAFIALNATFVAYYLYLQFFRR